MGSSNSTARLSTEYFDIHYGRVAFLLVVVDIEMFRPNDGEIEMAVLDLIPAEVLWVGSGCDHAQCQRGESESSTHARLRV